MLSFGIGRKNRSDDAPVDHPLFESASWDALPSARARRPAQQGAQAAGHRRQRQPLVDVFAEEDGDDLGRRALRQPRSRHTIASGYLALSPGESGASAWPTGSVLALVSRWAGTTGR